MSPTASTAPPQRNRPSAESIATGQTTNTNERPFSPEVKGNTNSFSPSTTIHNNQCQHIYGGSKSYHGCTFYETSRTPPSVAQEARTNAAAGSSDLEASPHPAEPRSSLMPLYWPLGPSIRLFVRAIVRVAAMLMGEHNFRHTIARALLSTLGRLDDSSLPRFPLTPSYWSWSLIHSVIRVLIRAAAMSIEERVPGDSITLNTQGTDLEAQIGMHPNMDGNDFPPPSASVPDWTPEAEEKV